MATWPIGTELDVRRTRPAKGQLISECLFAVLIFQKTITMLNRGAGCYSTNGMATWPIGTELDVRRTRPAKGQLISECLFAIFNFSKKTTQKFNTLNRGAGC